MVRNSRVTVRLYNMRVLIIYNGDNIIYIYIINIVMVMVRIIMITTQLSLIIRVVNTTGVVNM